MGNAQSPTKLLNNEQVIISFRKLKHSTNHEKEETHGGGLCQQQQVKKRRKRHPHDLDLADEQDHVDDDLSVASDCASLPPLHDAKSNAEANSYFQTHGAERSLTPPPPATSPSSGGGLHVKHRSSTRMHWYNRICANQLVLNETGPVAGRELTGVIVESPVMCMGALFFMMEDILGHLVIVGVYNLFSKKEEAEFFEGLCLTVKNPTYQDGLMESVSLIKVEDPHIRLALHGPAADASFLKHNRAAHSPIAGHKHAIHTIQPPRLRGVLPASAFDWYTVGNDFFRTAEEPVKIGGHQSDSNGVRNGMECIGNAILMTASYAELTLLSNRSAALMNASQPAAAVRDCIVILHIDPTNTTAFHRLIEALKAIGMHLIVGQLVAIRSEHKVHIHEKAVAEAYLLEQRQMAITQLMNSMWWEDRDDIVVALHERVPGFSFTKVCKRIGLSLGSKMLEKNCGRGSKSEEQHYSYAHQRLEVLSHQFPKPFDSSTTVDESIESKTKLSPRPSYLRRQQFLHGSVTCGASRNIPHHLPHLTIGRKGLNTELVDKQQSMLEEVRHENRFIQKQHAKGHHNVLPALVQNAHKNDDSNNSSIEEKKVEQSRTKTYYDWHEEGRKAFKHRDYSNATELFSDALSSYARVGHTDSATTREYLCHRSTKLFNVGDYVGSLMDASCACVIDSSCPIGWYRRAAALDKLERHGMALVSARAGMATIAAHPSRYNDLHVDMHRLEVLINDHYERQLAGKKDI